VPVWGVRFDDPLFHMKHTALGIHSFRRQTPVEIRRRTASLFADQASGLVSVSAFWTAWVFRAIAGEGASPRMWGGGRLATKNQNA
jgi:hypothetical protein